MLRIDVYRAAQRFIDRLPPKQQKQVMKKILSIAAQPEGQQDARPLRGHHGLFRADAGEYRIIYEIESDLLNILMAGKRNDSEIYRQLRRK